MVFDDVVVLAKEHGRAHLEISAAGVRTFKVGSDQDVVFYDNNYDCRNDSSSHEYMGETHFREIIKEYTSRLAHVKNYETLFVDESVTIP